MRFLGRGGSPRRRGGGARSSAGDAREGIQRDQLVLRSDNGGPTKGATLLATLQLLGILTSFSRPRVSNDNPFSEALFRTAKDRPEYPRRPFASLELLANRRDVYAAANKRRPERWATTTRDWSPIETVALKPEPSTPSRYRRATFDRGLAGGGGR